MRRIRVCVSLVAVCLVAISCGNDVSTGSSDSGGRPQILAIIADPFTIPPGDTSQVRVTVVNANIADLTFTYEATNGTITGSGARVAFVADSTEAVAWITVTISDALGNTATGMATINVAQEQPIMSIGVQVLEASSSGGKCLVFSALPAETLFFLRLVIENPVGQTFDIPGSFSLPVAANQPFALQFEGQCYTLHSGTYDFTFTLQRLQEQNSFAYNTVHVQP